MSTEPKVQAFLARVFPDVSPPFHLEPILSGKNNRAYQVMIYGMPIFLKQYNPRSMTAHDRLKKEYAFLRYAELCGCHAVAKPIAYDENACLALYEYIEGERYSQGSVTEFDIQKALDFLRNINQLRFILGSGVGLNHAVDACFSVQEHIHCVEQRVSRLQAMAVRDEVDSMAFEFINTNLRSVWDKLRQWLAKQCITHTIDERQILELNNRIISPSDFGFHNALKCEDGSVRFLDFEYAGWDDPAKLIGDFFNQVDVPVAMDYFPEFVGKLGELVSDAQELKVRAGLLLPLYRVKWCCIVLNYFLYEVKNMKAFVSNISSTTRMTQLKKAKDILSRVEALQSYI